MDNSTTTLTPPAKPRDFEFFVDGKWVARGDRELFERRSPGHGVAVSRVPKCTHKDLDDAVAAARRAFEERRWSGISGAERAAVLLKAGEGIRRRKDEIAYW